MFFQFCCCLKGTKKTDNIPTNETNYGGVNNKSFETWEPNSQQNSSSVTIESQPKLSESSRSSFESIKLSKIDLHLNIFENNRFCDTSEVIHKSNAQKSEPN